MKFEHNVVEGEWDNRLRIGALHNTKTKSVILRPPSSSSTGNNEGKVDKV